MRSRELSEMVVLNPTHSAFKCKREMKLLYLIVSELSSQSHKDEFTVLFVLCATKHEKLQVKSMSQWKKMRKTVVYAIFN